MAASLQILFICLAGYIGHIGEWMKEAVSLPGLRAKLVRMEDAIILGLARRQEYCRNDAIYNPGEIRIKGFKGSFLDYLLIGREKLDRTAGRYDDPRELPFFKPSNEERIVQRSVEKQEIPPLKINKNPEIMQLYISIIKGLCRKGDDGEYGSSAIVDICNLQDISSRVHLGAFVAEAKWRMDNSLRRFAERGEKENLKEALRDRKVEEGILERVEEKEKRYGLPRGIARDLYAGGIIPLTIEVEVGYLIEKMGEICA